MKKTLEKLPFISIVIVNYNGLDVLKICVPSLIKIKYPKDRYEVIVVDNDSNDGSVEYLRKQYPSIKIVQNRRNLGYVGINSALPYCKGKYIYFNNNDNAVNPDGVGEMAKALGSDDSIAMVVHTTINYYDRSLVSGGTWVSRSMYCGHYPKANNLDIKEIPYMGGAMIKKTFIENFGYLFDPDYFIYAEDLDLGLRIRLLGMKTIVVSKAVNYHMHSITMKKYSSQHKNTFLMERNSLITFFKIFSVKTIIALLPYVLLLRILTIGNDLLALKLKNALARIKAIVWIMLNFNMVMQKRKETQRLRKADDKYILKIFTEKYIFRKPFTV